MLRYWKHPQTEQVRLYVSTEVVQQALDICDLSYPASSVKAYYIMRDTPSSAAQLKVNIKTETPVPKRQILELKTQIGSAIEASSDDTWSDLEQKSKGKDTESKLCASAEKEKVQNTPPAQVASTPPSIQARNLDAAKVELAEVARVELSTRETHLMESLLSENPKVTITRAEGAMADIRLMTSTGIELLINRLRVSGKQTAGANSLEEKLESKDLFLDVEKLMFRAQTSDHPVIPVVLLEGNIGDTSVKLAQIDGLEAFLIGAQRLSVLQTLSIQHSAHVVLKLIQQVTNQESSVRKHYVKPTALIDQQSYLLQSLPGVSETMAEALLRHFASIQELLSASEADLAKVKGIGNKKAREIAKVLGTQLFK